MRSFTGRLRSRETDRAQIEAPHEIVYFLGIASGKIDPNPLLKLLRDKKVYQSVDLRGPTPKIKLGTAIDLVGHPNLNIVADVIQKAATNLAESDISKALNEGKTPYISSNGWNIILSEVEVGIIIKPSGTFSVVFSDSSNKFGGIEYIKQPDRVTESATRIADFRDNVLLRLGKEDIAAMLAQ